MHKKESINNLKLTHKTVIQAKKYLPEMLFYLPEPLTFYKISLKKKYLKDVDMKEENCVC